MPFVIHMKNYSIIFYHKSISSTFIINVHDSCEDFKGNSLKD
jgi:hypothetical protein